MKVTKQRLKQIIREELQCFAEGAETWDPMTWKKHGEREETEGDTNTDVTGDDVTNLDDVKAVVDAAQGSSAAYIVMKVEGFRSGVPLFATSDRSEAADAFVKMSREQVGGLERGDRYHRVTEWTGSEKKDITGEILKQALIAAGH